MFHLCQNVDLLLDVLPGHTPPRGLQPLFLDVLGCILVARRLLDHPENCSELSAEIEGEKLGHYGKDHEAFI